MSDKQKIWFINERSKLCTSDSKFNNKWLTDYKTIIGEFDVDNNNFACVLNKWIGSIRNTVGFDSTIYELKDKESILSGLQKYKKLNLSSLGAVSGVVEIASKPKYATVKLYGIK